MKRFCSIVFDELSLSRASALSKFWVWFDREFVIEISDSRWNSSKIWGCTANFCPPFYKWSLGLNRVKLLSESIIKKRNIFVAGSRRIIACQWFATRSSEFYRHITRSTAKNSLEEVRTWRNTFNKLSPRSVNRRNVWKNTADWFKILAEERIESSNFSKTLPSSWKLINWTPFFLIFTRSVPFAREFIVRN